MERLRPDLILLTGDYLNLSYIGEERAVSEVRRFLEQLGAHRGIYAVRGTPQVDPLAIMPTLFAGLPITVLEGERRELEVEGHRLRLVGVGCNRDPVGDGKALRQVMAGASGGIGLEGMGAPRARLLCPPQVRHIRLRGRG